MTQAGPVDFLRWRAIERLRELAGREGTRSLPVVLAGGGSSSCLALENRLRGVLESAVGARPWPDRRGRIAATALFNRVTERGTWAALRAAIRVAPAFALRALLPSLSTRPGGSLVASLTKDDGRALVELFSRMQSGRGFSNDLRHRRHPTHLLSQVDQPSLVVASRHDGAVPLAQAEELTAALRHARLMVSEAHSHFLWFGYDRTVISDEIRDFLAKT